MYDGRTKARIMSSTVYTLEGAYVDAKSNRWLALPNRCLRRDGKKCVVTGRYHVSEVMKWTRAQKPGPNDCVLDDDGQAVDEASCEYLETAYIIPHHLSDEQQVTIALLQMLNPSTSDLINEQLIDSPRNALTLCNRANHSFGNFRIWFEPWPEPDPSPGSHGGTYAVLARSRFDIPWLKYVIKERNVPEDRVQKCESQFGFAITFPSTPSCPAPSRELLQIHAAIAKVLHLSLAGYVGDGIDIEVDDEIYAQSDGCADFESSPSSRVKNWLHGLNSRGPSTWDE